MATHSSVLAWRIPWIEEPGRAIAYGVEKELGMTEQLNNNSDFCMLTPQGFIFFFLKFIL